MKNLLVLLLLVTQVSFAESYIKAAMSPADMESKGLFLDYLKQGCKDPASIHNQLPPTDIKVFCEQSQCRWFLGKPVKVTKENYKNSCGKIFTNKPNLGVGRKCSACSSYPTTFELPTLEEKCCEFKTVYQVTCDQVMKLDTVESFCLGQTDLEVASDNAILEWKPTGKVQTATMAPEVEQKPTQK